MPRWFGLPDSAKLMNSYRKDRKNLVRKYIRKLIAIAGVTALQMYR